MAGDHRSTDARYERPASRHDREGALAGDRDHPDLRQRYQGCYAPGTAAADRRLPAQAIQSG